MIKRILISLIFAGVVISVTAQGKFGLDRSVPRSLLVEKIGTRHRYAFEMGDLIRIRMKDRKVYHSYLWSIGDSTLEIGRNSPIRLQDIRTVYHKFNFINKLGTYMFFSGMAYFLIVPFDHLINNEIVFTKDVFIVPAALFGSGGITIYLSQKRCRIGDRWKLKVVGVRVN
jgi:hypothetical protein